MQLAVALYHNDVDDEDELEFRKGDILTVLIENPNGLNGWWLCEHQGKCGLCPANRLKLLSNSQYQAQTRASACLSTASMYDGLGNTDYDIPITASNSSNHDYDIPHRSDFISPPQTIQQLDSSPESSSRSSGIYSSVDLRLSDLSSSSLSEFHTSNLTNHSRSLSSMELDQLQDCFRKLSIRSLIVEKYRPLMLKLPHESHCRLFIHECRLFLHEYGCLFDRHTYKIFKQNLLMELEQISLHSITRFIHIATQILLLIKPIIETRVKQKHENVTAIPLDVLKKLNLEPIEETSNENETKKLPTSMSTTQIYGHFPNHSSSNHSRPSQMTTSRTCHSNILLESAKHSSTSQTTTTTNAKKSDEYDYIDDDYSSSPSPLISDPLIKCYHRHIRDHIASIFQRYSHLTQSKMPSNVNNLVAEGKAMVVAGHKLVFILETLHEHLRHSSKVQQISTPLMSLTRQLCDALQAFVLLLKQLTQDSCTKNANLISSFHHDSQSIMNIVKRIKRQCRSV